MGLKFFVGTVFSIKSFKVKMFELRWWITLFVIPQIDRKYSCRDGEVQAGVEFPWLEVFQAEECDKEGLSSSSLVVR